MKKDLKHKCNVSYCEGSRHPELDGLTFCEYYKVLKKGMLYFKKQVDVKDYKKVVGSLGTC